MNRRTFLALTAGAACELSMRLSPNSVANAMQSNSKKPFKISLAQWSLNRRLFGKEQPHMDNLDFAKTARGYGIDAVEYVNQFFMDKAADKKYLAEMKKRAADNGVKSLLIMCDGEGSIGDPDDIKRDTAVKNHYKWVDAAKFLGCHSIRVNAHSGGSYERQINLVADGLGRLCQYAAKVNLNVIVENHGGLSSNPDWLVAVMQKVNLPNCGTLPDFGNFPPEIDRYHAVKTMMPFAKAVSAKSQSFDENGNESSTDFLRMMKIVTDAGYSGYVGIEYEGEINEDNGIIATKKLLEKVGKKIKTV